MPPAGFQYLWRHSSGAELDRQARAAFSDVLRSLPVCVHECVRHGWGAASAETPGGSSRILMFRKWISAPSDSRQRYPFFCDERLKPFTNLPFTESFITPSTATTS